MNPEKIANNTIILAMARASMVLALPTIATLFWLYTNWQEDKLNSIRAWPDPIGWSGFNLSSCSALGLLPGQMTVLLRLLAQAR